MDFVASTSQLSYWGSSASVLCNVPSRPPPSTALNLLVAITRADLTCYTAAELRLTRLEVRSAGVGAYATVEIGQTLDKQLVAVKRSRILSQPLKMDDENAFEKHLNQLCLELRILSHKRLRRHSNILNILGLCVDEYSGRLSLSLVLEYSALGTLTSFLHDSQGSISIIEHVDMTFQVAQGLEALHKLRICHGDVKTQNALVFQEQEMWRVKLSDFGQSIVAAQDNLSGPVQYQFGTRLLNAPEIRNGAAINNLLFNIDAAILTDIFSFGLLTWEVLKNGQSFVERNWIEHCSDETNVELIEIFLNNLPTNGLHDYSLEFLENTDLNHSAKQRISMVFEGSLQDIPQYRRPMSSLTKMLDMGKEIPELGDLQTLDDNSDQALLTWTEGQSLYEVYDSGLENGIVIDSLPVSLQERILSELKLLASSEAMPSAVRAHAAMTVSECYTSGFGIAHDTKEVVDWLLKAASHGSHKAASWYHRVCHATEIAPTSNEDTSRSQALEQDLSLLPTDLYLTTRVQRLAAGLMQQVRDATRFISIPSDFPAGFTFRLAIFNNWEMDEILPLHFAAWVGNDALVEALLQNTAVDVISARGLSAAHYACFGGQLSTLRILINHNIPVCTTGLYGITPLHLSIFFTRDDSNAAVNLLLDNGAAPDAATTAAIKWEDHDIILSGTPLDWAVLTRNKNLVHTLLPHCRGYDCLHIAISHFFWEIADDLLELFQSRGDIPKEFTYLYPVKRPFSHWISQGRDHVAAINQTVRVCQKYDLLGVNSDGFTPLMDIVCAARVEDDFLLIEALLDISSSPTVKQTNAEGFSALLYAISMTKHNNRWRKTLQKLTEHYTVEELEEKAMFTGSCLHLAVTNDSVVGARVLLEKGVNVNQPTFDEHESTPLHLCIYTSGSTLMYSLLIKHGAGLQIRHPVTGETPLQSRLMGLQHNTELLDMALNVRHEEAIYGETLHGMLSVSMGLGRAHRADSREAFRYLLAAESMTKYINYVDESGATLIQRAAYHLHLDSVRLLLEAGADASIPLDAGGTQILPLQIAFSVGRLFWMNHASEESPNLREKREMAMGVTAELLQWHHARGDELFTGISALHLASGMAILDEVQSLLANNYNPEAKGHWPGLDHEVTPEELMEEELENQIIALEALKPQVAKEEGASQAPVTMPLAFESSSISAVLERIRASLLGSKEVLD